MEVGGGETHRMTVGTPPDHNLSTPCKKKNTSGAHHCGHAAAKGFTSPRAWKFRISGRMFVLERFRVLSDSLFSLFRDRDFF